MTPKEDSDPEKTLFFTRRQEGITRLPRIVGWVLVAGSGALMLWALALPSKPSIAEMTAELPPESSAAHPLAALPPAAPTVEPVPAPPETVGPLNLDVKDPVNAAVREDVLRRIDLMPGVSATNKDKLYASVDHARSMGKVFTIPFFKGETSTRPSEVERLRRRLESDEIRAVTDDPSVVFVVLGYADQKGSGKVNADVSLSRARSVLEALRDRCGVQNVMHAVAMGGSTMFSAHEADKNRVVEVWAVLP